MDIEKYKQNTYVCTGDFWKHTEMNNGGYMEIEMYIV